MKKLLAIVSAMLLMVSCFSFTACGDNKSQAGVVTIGYYSGGYGTAWLDAIIEEYREETGNEVIYDANSSVLATMETDLRDDNAYDMYISHGIPVERYAAAGYLKSLDDLYEEEVSTGVSFEKRVIDIALEVSKYDGHYYKVPYTQGVGGIVYNMDMFKENGWEIPKTYDDLVALCKTIRDAKIVVQDQYVAPFVWGGNGEEYMWDYLVNEWWAQMVGVDKIAQTVQYADSSVFDPNGNYKEFKEAYKLWYDLIVGTKSNSMEGVSGLTKTTSQAAFKNGLAAMIPNAHWIYNEMSLINLNFEIGFMPTPKAPNAKDDTKYNYLVGFGDSIVVSKNTPNYEQVKDFLKFLSRPENCATFTEKTNGTFLAFDYADVVIDESAVSKQAYTFIQSVKDKLTTSTSFSTYSTSPIAYMTNEVMTFPGNQYFYTAAFTGSSALIDGAITPDSVFKYLYDYAQNNWTRWEIMAGIR